MDTRTRITDHLMSAERTLGTVKDDIEKNLTQASTLLEQWRDEVQTDQEWAIQSCEDLVTDIDGAIDGLGDLSHSLESALESFLLSSRSGR